MDTEKAQEETSVSSDNGVDTATNNPDTGILARLLALEARLDAKMGVEAEAITRKRAEDKRPVPWHQQLNMMFLWASGSMNTSCFAIGFLGHDLGLTLRQSVIITIFATLLGGAATGFAATFGAPTGLRQISISRYSFGWWPTKVIALLNTIQQIGWAAVACIAGGLALEAVADGHVSLVVGIVIILCVSTVFSFIGLRGVLLYERYAWFVFFVIFIIIFAETAKYTDNGTTSTLQGASLAGRALTLLAIVYGSSASWQVIASDYYAHYPVDVNRWKVFTLTTLGVAVPTSIGMCAGIVVSFGLNNRPDWDTVYRTQGLGFLVQTVLYPHGFAKLILTLLVLSGINTNVISIYSAAISCQQLARPLARIPRTLWVLLSFAAILALAIGGRAKLSTYLQNFLSLLGYWCTQYFVIVCSEHVVFRKMNFANYHLDAWNDPLRLPLGLAAGAAFALGTVAWLMGMVQTWFVGPLARQIGGGGDVGNEFTLVVTALIYIPARALERSIVGR